MKKIVILGSGGFVGKSLTEYFSHDTAHGYEVVPVTRSLVDLSDGAAVREFMEAQRPDVVLNCAAVGGSRKNGYNDCADVADLNFRLFENVEKALADLPDTVHVIFGSGAQYDKSGPLAKVSESAIGLSVPKDPYGLGKYRIAKYIGEKGRKLTLMPVIFALFGPYEDYTYKFISNACVKTMMGMDIVINRNVVFDYLYIDDFCRIIGILLEKLTGGERIPNKIFNITPTRSVTLEEIARTVKEVSGKAPGIKVLNEGLNPEYTGNNSLMLENLGGRYDFLSLKESVGRLYKDLEARLSELDTESVKADAALKFAQVITRK
ncbi:MAG: NAD-dependent epimerase/dehydratase family protein [Clostridia bacterium]|nr:NAD-dependent epimerase/dehydratase family protein [Clostridia bacterium]